MNLIIDYGNTTAKVGIFDDHALVEKYTFSEVGKFKNFLELKVFEYAIISSVSIDPNEIASWLKVTAESFILNAQLPLPINNLYKTPLTLGVDRLAGACGAIELFSDTNTLIIDAGTCITYDFIDSNKNYLGGAISPGLQMRFKAVNKFTSKLPLVEVTDKPDLIGNSTETCIQSGVILGMIGEIDGIIMRYLDKYSDLRVILCGGDAAFFENKLKASIFAAPDLVLVGLNRILIHNVNR